MIKIILNSFISIVSFVLFFLTTGYVITVGKVGTNIKRDYVIFSIVVILGILRSRI